MDRVMLAVIVSAVLLLIGASGLYMTNAADVMHHARTVGIVSPNR